MPLDSEDKGSLKGFDMVLAISENAINNQLELLYRTPAKKLPLPQPGTTQPRTEYLISHDVSMHYPLEEADGSYLKNDDGSFIMSDDGIDGWIKAPRVLIHDRKAMSTKVSLTFCANPEPIKGAVNDSFYTYWVRQGPRAVKKSTNINGWTVSWHADLSSTEIQKMQEDLIALPDEVKGTLKGYVDSKDFLVSSVFCLMEDVQLVNTISVTDAAGQDISTGQWLTSFVLALKAWIGFASKSQGTPTPQNPFVLGYGISQTPTPDPGVPLFAPRRFQFSTSTNSDRAISCLNFCMTSKDDRTVDTTNDGNAGNFVPSLVRQMNLNPTEGDGVMAISNGIFYQYFIKPHFVDVFGFDFRDEVKSVLNAGDNITNVDTGKNYTNEPLGGATPCVYERQGNWEAEIPPHNTTRRKLAIQERTYFYGSESLKVTWASDPIPPGPHQDSVQRRATITIYTSVSIQNRVRSNTRLGADWAWSDLARAYFTANLKATYVLYSTTDGQWFLSFDSNNSFLPQTTTDPASNRATVACTAREPANATDLGVYQWSKGDGYFGLFGGTGEEAMLEQLSGWGSGDIQTLNDKLAHMMSLMQGKIILPAGNVFMFKGLNVDAAGNLLTGVKYSSISEGVKIT